MGWLLAALSGILAALSYPTVFGSLTLPDLGFLGFVCWIPLFAAIGDLPPKRAFAYGFTAGMFHYGISMYWLYTALNSFGGISPVLTVLCLLLLVVVLSLYFGLIFLASQTICLRFSLSSLWVRPLVWVAIEYLRGHVPVGGMPWSQIGYSQGGFLAFIQVADLFGVYGVTGLLVFFNEAIGRILSALRQGPLRLARVPGLAGAAVFAAVLAYGWFRLHQAPPEPLAQLQAGIVQGNIPQDEKWQRGAARRIISVFREGTQALEAKGADLIIWPEASWPLETKYDEPQLRFDMGNSRADLLFGSISRSRASSLTAEKEPFHNTAILAEADGRVLDYYHKVHLVPFGEYIPFEKVIFFAKKLTAQVGHLLPGEGYYPMKYRDRLLGVLICYEDIFPEIARTMAAEGAQALINITNDAWYGRSSAAFQHQVFSQFRAVETRRALVRASNTGISSAIDRWGRILWQGGLFTREDFLTALPLYADRTIYVRTGDLLPFAALAFCGVFLTLALLRRNPLNSRHNTRP